MWPFTTIKRLKQKIAWQEELLRMACFHLELKHPDMPLIKLIKGDPYWCYHKDMVGQVLTAAPWIVNPVGRVRFPGPPQDITSYNSVRSYMFIERAIKLFLVVFGLGIITVLPLPLFIIWIGMAVYSAFWIKFFHRWW